MASGSQLVRLNLKSYLILADWMGDERTGAGEEARRRRRVDGGAQDEDENGRTSSAELAQRDDV